MMKWLLLGYGDLAEKRVAAALQQAKGSELTAVWGRDANKCKTFANSHNISKYFAGMECLDLALNENIDAVYVCTPVDTHLDYTLKSLIASKHVFCEKPMAIDVGQCKQMIDCANENNLKLGIAYYRRCFPNVIRMKESIDQDALGKIICVDMKFQEYYCPPENSQQYWRVLPERAGGGVSFDVGSHRLDVLNYLFGDVKLVNSQKANLVHDYPAEDTATFFMQLENFNKAPAVLNVSWACKNIVDSLIITGSDAIVFVKNLSEPEIKIITNNETETLVLPKAANVHIPIIEDFVRAVDGDEVSVCSGIEGLKTNILLESIRETE
jgi:predicted dehydrogenase